MMKLFPYPIQVPRQSAKIIQDTLLGLVALLKFDTIMKLSESWKQDHVTLNTV